MELLLASFLAGILTILAPCVLPLLPIIIGGSVQEKGIQRPLLITGSLALSIIFFTLILKASTLLIDISPNFWKLLSGGLVFAIGIFTLFPNLWKQISLFISSKSNSQSYIQNNGNKKGVLSTILTGAALGPVFSSCSPTFALILAIVLPANLYVGILNLIFYSLGLSLVMLLIAIFGQKLVSKLKGISNPNSVFKKALGIIFMLIGLIIITGLDKSIESIVINSGFTEPIFKLEQVMLNKISN